MTNFLPRSFGILNSEERSGFLQRWLEVSSIGISKAEGKEPVCSCVGFSQAERTPYEESSGCSFFKMGLRPFHGQTNDGFVVLKRM